MSSIPDYIPGDEVTESQKNIIAGNRRKVDFVKVDKSPQKPNAGTKKKTIKGATQSIPSEYKLVCKDKEVSVEKFANGFIIADYSGRRGEAAYCGKSLGWINQPAVKDPFETELDAYKMGASAKVPKASLIESK